MSALIWHILLYHLHVLQQALLELLEGVDQACFLIYHVHLLQRGQNLHAKESVAVISLLLRRQIPPCLNSLHLQYTRGLKPALNYIFMRTNPHLLIPVVALQRVVQEGLPLSSQLGHV